MRWTAHTGAAGGGAAPREARAIGQQCPIGPAGAGAPADPRIAVQQAEVQRKQAADQAGLQLEQQQLQAAQQDRQAQMQVDQANLQLEQQRLQLEAQGQQQETAMSAQEAQQGLVDAQAARQASAQEVMVREQSEDRRGELDRASRETMNESDNFTAMQLASMEIETGEKFAVSTGTGINP